MMDYEQLMDELADVPGAELFEIGKSAAGRGILCAHAGGKTGIQLIVTGAIHAREHITSALVVRLLKRFMRFSRDIPGGGIYFIPMMNPDGVELCAHGLDSVLCERERARLLELNGGSGDFSLWKANFNGVDLNVNFDANYGTGASNVTVPGPENYIGPHPLSEPETQALAEFTLAVKPACTISYHCKGEVIYWRFYQKENLLRDKVIADMVSRAIGYPLVDESDSAGGYKDWCIQKCYIPALTVEVGRDALSHPLPESELDSIFRRNKDVPYIVLKTLSEF